MGAGVWRAARKATAKGLEPPKQCSQPGSLNPGAALESDGMVKTFEHSQASSPRTSHTRLIKAWAKRQAAMFGLSNVVRREWSTAGVESGPNPPRDKRGTWKSRQCYPALAGPRQANRKAGPGETEWRGSNKPRLLCNGADMPTSIWSFVARNSMEPISLRRANDDRRQSERDRRGRSLVLILHRAAGFFSRVFELEKYSPLPSINTTH